MSSAYVGNRVQNVDIGEELDKVTRVVLVVDSDHVYTAGNDTGRTIEREIPWGSQAMADSLLRKLSGVAYKPFNAERALVSPAFEIGDPVTVGGVYSRIIGADINYGISGLVDLYAPDLDVTEDEYPSEKTQQSSIERQLASTRSLISKTSDEVRLEVFGEDGYTGTSIVAQLGELTGAVNGKINGEDAQALIKVALQKIELSISNDGGTTTFTLTGDGTQLDTTTFDLHVKAVNIDGSLTIGQLPEGVATTNDIPDVSNFVTERGVTTIINGTVTTDYVNALGITAASVSANNVTSGTLNADYITINGMFYIERSDVWGTAAGYIGANTSKEAIVMTAANQNVGCVVNNSAAKLSYYEQKMIWVHSGGCYTSETMQVYSDRSLKHDISYELEREAELFPKLKPCSFVYNQDTESKMHWGFVAQDFIEAATDAGYDPSTLAVLGQYEGKYSIGYGEVTALNTLMIQKLMNRVSYLERRMEV